MSVRRAQLDAKRLRRYASVCLLAMVLRRQTQADTGAFSRCQRMTRPFQPLLKRRVASWLLVAKERGMKTHLAIQW